jgi:FtsP/CotA-like multicopper oxidase with cupredoxin domain
VLAAVGRSNEPVRLGVDALDFTGEAATHLGEAMEMVQDDEGHWLHEADFFIDDQSWHPDPLGGVTQPLAPSARFARVGDTIRWEVTNTTRMAHPFHLHGFSYQPVEIRWYGDDEEEHRDAHDHYLRWPIEHVEFEDTTHLPPGASVVFHVELADPNGDGGAVGRWMKHCHIFQHGESGMMSELVVDP